MRSAGIAASYGRGAPPPIVLASIFSVGANIGLPLMGVLVGIEALGVPLPGETAVIFAGLAASQGRFSIVLVIIVAAAGAIIGDNIGFVIGRRGGRQLLERPGRFYAERQRVLRIGDPFFAKHGPKAVFLGRWITGLRVWTSWLAGASDMRWPTFLAWNALGGTCWATSVSLAAYYGGNGAKKVIGQIGLYGGIAAGVLIVLVGGYVWWRLKQRRESADVVPDATD
jgi:membrane protein DedA with SNARE-associated domain